MDKVWNVELGRSKKLFIKNNIFLTHDGNMPNKE